MSRYLVASDTSCRTQLDVEVMPSGCPTDFEFLPDKAEYEDPMLDRNREWSE